MHAEDTHADAFSRTIMVVRLAVACRRPCTLLSTPLAFPMHLPMCRCGGHVAVQCMVQGGATLAALLDLPAGLQARPGPDSVACRGGTISPSSAIGQAFAARLAAVFGVQNQQVGPSGVCTVKHGGPACAHGPLMHPHHVCWSLRRGSRWQVLGDAVGLWRTYMCTLHSFPTGARGQSRGGECG